MTAGSAALRCACGNVLGVFADGRFISRHQGRVIEAALVLAITCERCDRTTALTAPAPDPPPSEGPGGLTSPRAE
jgi:hypothetical protein